MSDLLALAERVEKAAGPDRALDAAIALGIGKKASVKYGHPALGNEYSAPAYFERYTASIDAAMLLVPEGWWVQHLGHCLSGWRARVETNGPPSHSIGIGFGSGKAPETAALALTAACLKARAASTPSLNAEIAGMGEGM